MKKKIFELMGIATMMAVVLVACRAEGENGSFYPHSGTGQENVISESTSGTVLKEDEEQMLVKEEVEQVYVHVCGAVVNPGVYALPAGSRLYEATAMAGGLVQEADTDGINLARGLRDGEQVRIPFGGELQEEDGLININHADEEQLCRIPGVGVAKAKAILLYRETNGPFESIEGLMDVSGIKEGLFEQMRPYIKCE